MRKAYQHAIQQLAALYPKRADARRLLRAVGVNDEIGGDTIFQVWERAIALARRRKMLGELLAAIASEQPAFTPDIARELARGPTGRNIADEVLTRAADALERVIGRMGMGMGNIFASMLSGKTAASPVEALDEVVPIPITGGARGEEVEMSPPPALTRLEMDVAVPESVVLKVAFSVAVLVRQPQSPKLIEADLPVVKTSGPLVEWPDQSFIRLRVEINAPNCEIEGEAAQQFRLFRGQDSQPMYFSLKPLVTDDINIIVRLYQEDDVLGSARVSTRVGAVASDTPAGQVKTSVQSVALDAGGRALPGRGAVRRALTSLFSKDEMQTLCFDLTELLSQNGVQTTITLDSFGGDTTEARAINLITFVERNGWYEWLVRAVLAARPNAFEAA